ncbi:MAG: ArsR family transcriptional regulator [Candidatus Korarchaeota archaeon]|nr:ArsR family transcriptional regulator [Candidatus Korarchaeota archaeon]
MYVRSRIYRAKKILNALSSDSKLRILKRLLKSPASATDLANEFGLTLPAITSHLRDLEEAGLIRIIEKRRGRGRPAKLYALTRKRITLEIDLEVLLELPDEESLDKLVNEYVRKKVREGGLRKVTVRDVMDTLGVSRAVAAVVAERLSSDPRPLIEAVADRVMEHLNGEKTTVELMKELNIDRWWVSKAVELLNEEGMVEVKAGRVKRLA